MDTENVNFRREPEKYRVGKGEEGVFQVEPYKSELLTHWRFKTEAEAEESSAKIYAMYEDYKQANDFVGMDMARKFLQMGFTRARRYANYTGGNKYDEDGEKLPKRDDSQTNEKAKAAGQFLKKYQKVLNDETYQNMKQAHKENSSAS
jgi:hypothetical protein